MKARTILWRRLDWPGHEAARLSSGNSRVLLEGTAVFARQGQPCRLDYRVTCDGKWQTLSAEIEGWSGDEQVTIALRADTSRRWRLNGKPWSPVDGCDDLDLQFSPSTNLLPVRRLNLAIGEEAEVVAAWLRFPGFTLEPLRQSYRRLSPLRYRYRAGDSLEKELTFNRAGFVTRYPGFWEAEKP
jgi:hypothetical protein